MDEWLGELCFVHFYRTLVDLSGMSFESNWNALTAWERQSWCEAAKTIAEVTGQRIMRVIPSLPYAAP